MATLEQMQHQLHLMLERLQAMEKETTKLQDLPAELERHLRTNEYRLDTCSATREEVRLFLEARLGHLAALKARDAAEEPGDTASAEIIPQKGQLRPMKNGKEVRDEAGGGKYVYLDDQRWRSRETGLFVKIRDVRAAQVSDAKRETRG